MSSFLVELGEARRMSPLSCRMLISWELCQGRQKDVLTFHDVWAP